jgi:hypothetical protein
MGGLSIVLVFVLGRKFSKILQGVPTASHPGETTQGLTHTEGRMLPGLTLAILGEKAILASQGSTHPSEGKGPLMQELKDASTRKVGETMRFLSEFLKELPHQRRQELNLGLEVLDLLPIAFFFRFSRFSELSMDEQKLFLVKLAEGPNFVYPLFLALKELVYLAHYHQPETYLNIGYPGPRRDNASLVNPVQARYLRLVAGK